MSKWFKGYFISSTYAQDISNQSCITNRETPCTNGGLMPDIMTIGTVFAFYQYNPTLVRFAKNEGLWTIFTFTDHTNLQYLNLTAQSQRLFPDMQTVVSNGSFILVLPFCFMVESARPGSCVMGPWVYAGTTLESSGPIACFDCSRNREFIQ